MFQCKITNQIRPSMRVFWDLFIAWGSCDWYIEIIRVFHKFWFVILCTAAGDFNRFNFTPLDPFSLTNIVNFPIRMDSFPNIFAFHCQNIFYFIPYSPSSSNHAAVRVCPRFATAPTVNILRSTAMGTFAKAVFHKTLVSKKLLRRTVFSVFSVVWDHLTSYFNFNSNVCRLADIP